MESCGTSRMRMSCKVRSLFILVAGLSGHRVVGPRTKKAHEEPFSRESLGKKTPLHRLCFNRFVMNYPGLAEGAAHVLTAAERRFDLAMAVGTLGNLNFCAIV